MNIIYSIIIVIISMIIALGQLRKCNEKYGWKYFQDWLHTRVDLMQASAGTGSGGGSHVMCGTDAKTSVVCAYHQVRVDFGAAVISGE